MNTRKAYFTCLCMISFDRSICHFFKVKLYFFINTIKENTKATPIPMTQARVNVVIFKLPSRMKQKEKMSILYDLINSISLFWMISWKAI